MGVLRKDLFHRLNVVTINLPRLVERLDDIDNLIDYFVEIFNRDNKEVLILNLLLKQIC